jgi:hypothetical protein
MVQLRQQGDAGLEAVEQIPTLRDRIVTLPVDPVVPNHWEVGCKVVKFNNELPADAITLKRPRRAQELILTTAGMDSSLTLGVYEHDRNKGRRNCVATTEHTHGNDIRRTLYEAFTVTCRQAARIDGLPPSIAAIDAQDPAVVIDGEQIHDPNDALSTEQKGLIARFLGKIKVY